MAQRICKADGCGKVCGGGSGLGWCAGHYSAQRLADPATPRCKIEECDRPIRGRGWCGLHYARWLHHGDPMIVTRGPKVCSVEGCDTAAVCRVLCDKHYTRWKRHGDPTVAIRPHLNLPEKVAGMLKQRRRRKMIAAQFVAPVVDQEIFERDGWICQLCHRPVNPATPRTAPGGATIDHIVPIYRGGLHCPENVQLAHYRCNIKKGHS